MIEQLTGLGYGLITLALVIGVGIIVLYKFGGSIATCAATYKYNSTLDKCSNGTTALDADPTDPGWETTHYLQTQLGSTNGGLATWTPAIIAAVIGFLFLAMFMGRKKNKGKY